MASPIDKNIEVIEVKEVNKETAENYREDKDTEKYKIALKFVNKILVNIGKDEIDDLLKFINIDREDIIKDVNKQIVYDMEKELFPLFNKMNSGFYRKDSKSFMLNILRCLMKEMGFFMVYIRKEKSERINNKCLARKHYYYSIK